MRTDAMTLNTCAYNQSKFTIRVSIPARSTKLRRFLQVSKVVHVAKDVSWTIKHVKENRPELSVVSFPHFCFFGSRLCQHDRNGSCCQKDPFVNIRGSLALFAVPDIPAGSLQRSDAYRIILWVETRTSTFTWIVGASTLPCMS